MQKVVLRNGLTRKRNDSRRLRTGRRRNDSLAKHTCTMYIIFIQELRDEKLHVHSENSVLAPQETIWRTDNVHFVKSIFFNLLRTKKVVWIIKNFEILGLKLKSLRGKRVRFGSSYFEGLKIEGLESTIFKTFTFSFYTSVSFFFLLSHKPPTFSESGMSFTFKRRNLDAFVAMSFSFDC